MVCYARPASRLAAIVLVAWLVFAVPVSHFFDTAALVTAVMVATAGAAVAAALAFATFMSVRRRRAAAGGCVSCQFRCQHAMTGPDRRLWLVTTVDRTPGADRPATAPGHPGTRGHRGSVPARSVPIVLPVPTARSAAPAPAAASAESCGPAAPRWPDRPAHRAAQVSHRAPRAAVHVPRRERAGSPALAAGGEAGRQRRLDRRPFGRDHREHGRVPQHPFLAGAARVMLMRLSYPRSAQRPMST